MQQVADTLLPSWVTARGQMQCAWLGQAATASLEGQQDKNNNTDKCLCGGGEQPFACLLATLLQALQTTGVGTSCFALTSTSAKLPRFSGQQDLAWLLLFFVLSWWEVNVSA